MPALPLDPQIQGSAERLEKAHAALTKDFDPSQPRDKNGRWVHLGHSVETPSGMFGHVTGISGPDHVSVDYLKPGDRYPTAHGHKAEELRVRDNHVNETVDREKNTSSGSVTQDVIDAATARYRRLNRTENTSRRQEAEELAEEEHNLRVNELRAKVAAARPGEERELAEEELEDELHPGRYKG